MSTNQQPTPTLTIAKALRVIAGDLGGDGAPIAAVSLNDAADRLVALERRIMTAKAGLRAILDGYQFVTERRRFYVVKGCKQEVYPVAVFQHMADIASETLKGVDEIKI